MRIGFTGTQDGMTEEQKVTVKTLLEFNFTSFREIRHGDCVGADEEVHQIAENLSMDIIVHPPIDDRKRAFCNGLEVKEPKPYLSRNRDIVDATHILLAAPKGPERVRSGTWATIRYAKRIKHPVHVVHPDGRYEVL